MTNPQPAKKAPDFRAGDTVRIHLKVVEGESERIQVFEGVVLRRRGIGASQTFTVRKISFGVGVERIFPLNSPRIDRIELTRPGRARRARLYYLRGLTGKAARLDSQSREGEAPAQGPAAGSAAADGAKAARAGGSAAPAEGGSKAPPAASAAPAVR